MTGYTNMVFDVAEGVTLSGIDKAPAEGDDPVAERAVAALYGVSAGLRWTWVEQNVEVSLGGLWNVSPGDFVANAQISYFDWEPHTFRLGAVLVDGPSGTLGPQLWRERFCLPRVRCLLLIRHYFGLTVVTISVVRGKSRNNSCSVSSPQILFDYPNT